MATAQTVSETTAWFQAQRAKAQQHVRSTPWWHELCWEEGFESEKADGGFGRSMGGQDGAVPHLFFGERALFYAERGRHVVTPTHFVYCVSFLPWTMNTSSNAFGGATSVVVDMLTAAAKIDPAQPSPTARMQVKFRRPVPVPGVFRVDVRHTAAEPAVGSHNPRITMELEMTDESGEVLASAEVVVSLLPTRFADLHRGMERFAVLHGAGSAPPPLPPAPEPWDVEDSPTAMALVPSSVSSYILSEAAVTQAEMDIHPYWQKVLADTQRWPIQHTQITSPANRAMAGGSHFLTGILSPWSLQRVLNAACDEQLWLVHFSPHCKNGFPGTGKHVGNVHGGAICAALDMVLSNGWHAGAGQADIGPPASNGWTTTVLEIKFKKPVPLPDVYTIRARVDSAEETPKGPKVQVSAELTSAGEGDDVEVYATATGTLVAPQASKRDASAWKPLDTSKTLHIVRHGESEDRKSVV